MPLLVYVVSAWLLGLFAATIWGEHSTIAATIVCGLLCLITSAVLGTIAKRAHTFVASVTVAIVGFVMGSISAQQRAACRTQLSNPNVSLSIALDARAKPGAFVRGEAIGQTAIGECRLNATLKVRDGNAPPGNVAQFSGARLVTERGLKLDGDVQRGTRDMILRAWRGRAGESLDTLFGPRAVLARALLIADQDGIDPMVRDRFADAGLIHILSISGLHVALIAGALSVIASAMRLPRGLAAFGSLFLVLLYVLALGAPPPAVRSAIMLATSTIVSRLQRPVHPWTALALGAAVPTWRPDVVLDLGWQLSVSGMASLVAARSIMRRVRHSSPALPKPRDTVWRRRWKRLQIAIVAWLRSLDGWRWTLTRELFTGTIASIVTAPIVAWYFGRISIIAPLSNIAASPVIAFLQPALFLALVLAPWHAVAKLAADACIAPLALLDFVA
ncbi:MAG: ComEC/Rec2 family competence protein, partial [Gemmatimonadaceae bacterium]